MRNPQIRNIYDNFRFSVQILVKIILNFLDLSVFPIFIIFVFKLDANFPSLWPKSMYFLYAFTSLFKVEFDIDHFVLGEHRER